MTAPASPHDQRANQPPLGFVEFVALMASIMALNALGIDSMLPALPAIGHSLGVENPNHHQFVITAFMIGFAFAQLVYGPLSDRYGRRPIVAWGLAAYAVTSMLAAISGSFALLMVARAAMGASAAAARVTTVAIVRDCFSGRAMARVMSLMLIVFMAAPVMAPLFGQTVLLFAGWRVIFWGVAGAAMAILIWFWSRLPETLAAENRQSLDPRRILRDYAIVVRDRYSVGYTLGAAAIGGGIFGFLGSIQQIMEKVFHAPGLLVPVFGSVAIAMAIGAFVNSAIVMRFGQRLISHIALLLLTAIAGLHLLIAWVGLEFIWTFAVLQALMMSCFGMVGANFSSMAMERMGEIAGTASSLQGFVNTLFSALVGALIGSFFDGTTVPLYMGFLSMGLFSLAVVAITERGKLFQPH